MLDDLPAVLRATGPVPLRQRLYRALAQAVATAPGPSLVAFESTGDMPVPWIVARPGALIRVVRADPGLRAAALEHSEIPLPAHPEPEGVGRFAVLTPRADVSGRSIRSDPFPLPLVGEITGPRDWLGTQTFWVARATGVVTVARRLWYVAPTVSELDRRFDGVAIAAAEEWGRAIGGSSSFVRPGIGARRDWCRLATRSFPGEAWTVIGPERLDRTAEPAGTTPGSLEVAVDGHALVLGASGAGKTWFLADRAARAISGGHPVVAIDLHGDLAPAVVARVNPEARSRIVALDLSNRPVAGIAAIGPQLSPERAAAHLVAAIKRLSPDGAEVYWGYRLERIFDGFVRLAQESGGSLLDVHTLLTDPDRRDAARLATHSPDLARFLEELGAVVRRNPEFLWGAAARLSGVVANPALSELLAPSDGGVPVEDLLTEGRSVLVRAPFGLLGPEAAAFAGTLVLARVYLGLAARRTDGRPGPTVMAVLDEVQGFSPRLVAEMISEGRKFGFRILVATQFPERLAPELRAAVAGVVRDFVSFRIPLPSVPVVGRWLGLSSVEAEHCLVDLPPGFGVAHDPDLRGLRSVVPSLSPPTSGRAAWSSAVRATREEFDPEPVRGADALSPDLTTERILLVVLGAEEEGRAVGDDDIVAAAERFEGPAIDRATLSDRLRSLGPRGYLTFGPRGYHLTSAGERWLGLGASTGATRESAEHRGLLLAAFRIFARRGCRLEIVRQGRYDTRLPDAFFRQIPERLRSGRPSELAGLLERIRHGWAWRYFGGRDVHVEAEVSGALRPARIRHGLAKAAAREAYALYLVTDGKRASRIRTLLSSLGVGRDRARVWILRPGGPRTVDAPPFPFRSGVPPRSELEASRGQTA